MKRQFRHYEQLEEFHAGMWRITRGDTRKANIHAAAAVMRNAGLFKTMMLRALVEWPNSCEHNLSAESVNRIAWLGHAGCCIGAGAPEDCTRLAWHTLSRPEQDEANRVADEVLREWLDAQSLEPGGGLFATT